MYRAKFSLHYSKGEHKYLNQAERLTFLEVTKTCKTDTKLFCQLLYYTGARISEILNLSIGNIDFDNDTVVIETLKKRQKGIYREIPLPKHLLHDLLTYIDNLDHVDDDTRLWWFSPRTASRRVKKIMHKAHITGVRSCARGLRHGFAVYAVGKVPLTLVQKWLGHASLETTAIYLEVVGPEERAMARRIW
ncbi:site-specific integrase [Winogradskyella sp.]|uniref:tyrosine-type recombinase/integrase n=1 Tax=Winogradskyella sp. TaxID=1883156 RepID=UPI00260A7272|nr:site-specific integrase [Winogradskyella sp.]